MIENSTLREETGKALNSLLSEVQGSVQDSNKSNMTMETSRGSNVTYKSLDIETFRKLVSSTDKVLR